MRIVIAPDSFKECLSSTRVADCISKGIQRVFPEAEIVCIPMSDGGEGTVEALVKATCGKIIHADSVDALNRPIHSFYGILGDGKTAVIEMAAASGIELLKTEERNPLITSTFGTGLLIKAALEKGYNNIIIGIGGSATNDGGAGMAQAFGFGLFDVNGIEIGPGGGSLNRLTTIDQSNVNPLLRNAKITIASDVKNPLLGTSGATNIYGSQKGATSEMLEILEKNMAHFAQVLLQAFGIDYSNIPGVGAAGGLGVGLMAFCHAEMDSGFGIIRKYTQLEEQISMANLVFTGEGKVDSQTLQGKMVGGIAEIGKKYKIPVIVLAGDISKMPEEIYQLGVTSVFSISKRQISLEESKARAAELIADTAERIMVRLGNADSW